MARGVYCVPWNFAQAFGKMYSRYVDLCITGAPEMEKSAELVEAVRKTAVERDGQLILSCAQAFKIADQYDAGLGDIGRICNEERIKIVRCQLGCFK